MELTQSDVSPLNRPNASEIIESTPAVAAKTPNNANERTTDSSRDMPYAFRLAKNIHSRTPMPEKVAGTNDDNMTRQNVGSNWKNPTSAIFDIRTHEIAVDPITPTKARGKAMAIDA
jgi:hypothetical protein